jgi:hypothetical protein
MLLLQGDIPNGFPVVQTIVIRTLLLLDTVDSLVLFVSLKPLASTPVHHGIQAPDLTLEGYGPF